MPSVLLWLIKWLSAIDNAEQTDLTDRIVFSTYDNPCWGVKIYLPEEVKISGRDFYKLYDFGENDWHSFSMKESTFNAYVVPGKLEFAVERIREFFIDAMIPTEKIELNDDLISDESIRKLDKWYLEQCDGDWEHSYVVSITMSNAEWSFDIDVAYTDYDVTQIGKYEEYIDQNDWYTIEINAEKFIAKGDLLKFSFIVNYFLGFAIDKK